MYIVRQNFSGIVAGSEGQVIDIKDKAIANDLLNAGYIEVYNEKNKNTSELKKENESLKKEKANLELEIENLKKSLEEAQNSAPAEEPETPEENEPATELEAEE